MRDRRIATMPMQVSGTALLAALQGPALNADAGWTDHRRSGARSELMATVSLISRAPCVAPSIQVADR
jgi:hypothetical protein